MDRWKAEQGRGREKRKIRRDNIRRERVRRKKMQMREKVGKSRNTVFFQWFVAPEGRKVGSLKRRVRSQLARWEMKICTPLWREAHFEVKMYKTHLARTTFGSWDVEKVHAVVARSTFWSQNVQNTPASDHFWKLRCRKSARRCGAKHISKSKCTKHYKAPHVRATFGGSDVEKVHAVVARSTFRSQNAQNTSVSDDFWKLRCRKSARRCGAKHISKSKCAKHLSVGRLLEVEMSKKCTPLWREAHFEVKMYKTHQRRTTFGSWDVEKVHAVVARSTFPSQNVQSITKHHMFAPLLEVRMWKKCTPLWREAHFEVKMYKTHQRRTTFGSWDVEKVHAVVARSTFPSQNVQNTPASDHFWKLRCRKSARRCGAKHISKSKCTKHTSIGPPLWKLRCRKSARRCGVKIQNIRGLDHFWRFRCRFASRHYTTGHYTTLHSSTLHYTPLHYITLHYIPLHYTTLQLHNYTPLHSTTLHCTKLHYTTLHDTTLHYTTLHYTTLHSNNTLHYTTLHCTTLHSTTLHYTTLQYTTLH